VKGVRQRADRVRRVPTDERTRGVRLSRHARHIEQLPAAVEHRGQDGERDVRGKGVRDVVFVQGVAVARGDQLELAPRPLGPGGERVEVAGKIEAGRQQVAARPLRVCKSRQQRVQVAGDAAGAMTSRG
jgi:hypothetical protein